MSIELKIKKVQEADSALDLVNAVKELAATGDPLSIPTLIEVLGYNNPGAAVAAVEGLVKLGEVAVLPILNLLDGYNYGARAWAIRALAEIGDNRALDLLLDSAANDFSPSVRRSAAKGLGNLAWQKFSLTEVEQVKRAVLDSLIPVSQELEWVVRYAAIAALESLALADQSLLQQEIYEYLDTRLGLENEVSVQARIRLALAKTAI